MFRRIEQATPWALKQRSDRFRALERACAPYTGELLLGNSRQLGILNMRLLLPPSFSAYRARHPQGGVLNLYLPSLTPINPLTEVQSYAFVLTLAQTRNLLDAVIPLASNVWELFQQPWLDAQATNRAFHYACTGQLRFESFEQDYKSPRELCPLRS